MQQTRVQSLGQKDLLEKGMAICCSIVAWKFAWTEEPGRLQSMRLQRVGHKWIPMHAQWKVVFRNQILGRRYDHCYWDITAIGFLHTHLSVHLSSIYHLISILILIISVPCHRIPSCHLSIFITSLSHSKKPTSIIYNIYIYVFPQS